MAKETDKKKPDKAAEGTEAPADAGKGKKAKAEKKPAAKTEKKSDNPDFKYIVRIANTDLTGHKHVPLALTGIRGIGNRVAPILVDRASVPRAVKIGDLDDASIDRLRKVVDDQLLDALPIWMVNRRKDINSGEDVHLIGTDLDGIRREDLNRLKKIRTFRGVRHDTGQKVRGQRSRSNGRIGLAMGVIKKKEGPQPGGDKKE